MTTAEGSHSRGNAGRVSGEHGEDKRSDVPDMIKCIQQGLGYSEAGIAAELDVNQASVSRWYNGECLPCKQHLSKLGELVEEARQHLGASFLIHTDFQYLCSFAPKYSHDHVYEAQRALRRTLKSPVPASCRGDEEPGLHLDLSVRAAALPKDVLAHCFADRPDAPSVCVILVNKSFSLSDQMRIAYDEAYAHIVHKFARAMSRVKHPAPLL